MSSFKTRSIYTPAISRSSTNMHKGVELDIFVFNHYLNEAWLHGRLDAMENFPKDFNQHYLSSILAAADDARVRGRMDEVDSEIQSAVRKLWL